MKTYRYRGHSMSDPAKYRTREEVNEFRDHKDPLDLARKNLIEAGWSDEDALKAMDKEVKQIVNESAEFAKDSPEPDASELYTDVLVEG